MEDIEKIQYSLTFGFSDALTETFTIYENTVEFAKELSSSDKYPTKEQLEFAIKETGVSEKPEDAFERAFGLALCDVGKITNLPSSMMDELSWRIGEDTDFWAVGMYAG